LIVAGKLVQQTKKGEIRIIRSGKTLSPIYAGIPIERGDQIHTAQNAEAVVDFEYGIRAYLGRNTQIALSSVRVTAGEVLVRIQDSFFQVKGRFDLETSIASAIAQGTEYYVRREVNEVSYVVLQGRVLVEPKPPATWQPIFLGQNEQVILAQGQPPRGPLPANPREIALIQRWRDRLESLMGTDPVKRAIERILGHKVETLPPPTSRPASGVTGTQVTFKNHTGHHLRVYLRGPVSRLVEVPNGQTREVSLVAGRYQVAAETSDRKITPFYGEHSYQPQTSQGYTFILRRQLR
jgi:hypothetical protein